MSERYTAEQYADLLRDHEIDGPAQYAELTGRVLFSQTATATADGDSFRRGS